MGLPPLAPPVVWPPLVPLLDDWQTLAAQPVLPPKVPEEVPPPVVAPAEVVLPEELPALVGLSPVVAAALVPPALWLEPLEPTEPAEVVPAEAEPPSRP
jgi:hypothetical protein